MAISIQNVTDTPLPCPIYAIAADSVRQHAFVQAPDWLLDLVRCATDISAEAKWTWLGLYQLAWHRKGSVLGPIARIARQLGLPRQTLYRHLDKLEAAGWLHIEDLGASRYRLSPTAPRAEQALSTAKERRRGPEPSQRPAAPPRATVPSPVQRLLAMPQYQWREQIEAMSEEEAEKFLAETDRSDHPSAGALSAEIAKVKNITGSPLDALPGEPPATKESRQLRDQQVAPITPSHEPSTPVARILSRKEKAYLLTCVHNLVHREGFKFSCPLIALADEVYWAITRGRSSDPHYGYRQALRGCLTMIRNNTWRTPSGMPANYRSGLRFQGRLARRDSESRCRSRETAI